MRLLFQGDSITDGGRDRRNYYHMGEGYPKYAAESLKSEFSDLECINLGISGNRSGQLFDRSVKDLIWLQPDVVSILIGINDIWHRYHAAAPVLTTDEQFALNYRTLLQQVRAQTNAKIVILSPFLLDKEDKQHFRPDLDRLLPIVEALAAEFADVYVPLDKLFGEALKTQPEPYFYSADGVHPNKEGAAFIGNIYADAVRPLLK